MRYRILYLCIGIFMLFVFSKCEDAVTVSQNSNTDLEQPQLISPEKGSEQSTSVTFEWQEVEGADSYQIQVSKSAEFNSTLIDSVSDSTSFEVSGLPGDTTLHWQVRAQLKEHQGPWSESWSFSTQANSDPVTTTLQSPEDGATGLSTDTTVQWSTVATADVYRVQVATDQNFSSTVVDQDTENASYDLNDLQTDQTYYWRVEPSVDGEQTEWSNVRDFQTVADTSTNDGSTDDGSSSPGSVEGDRQALMDLYNATGGDSWNNNAGWGDGNPTDSWEGVQVDADGRVVRLDLYKNGLSGQLPASIGNLTKLTYLNVKGNQLTGEIPSEIGNMASLEWLILSGRTKKIDSHSPKEPTSDFKFAYHAGKSNSATNDFTGDIPVDIGNLKNLKRFELSGSSITSIPSEIGNCSALEGLYISWSANLTHSMPSTIGNLTELRHLYLANNKMTGDLPASLSNLNKLMHINLGSKDNDRNKFTGPFPDFSGATNLRNVAFDQNELSGDWPQYWNNGDFDKLNTLGASWNSFTGTMHNFDNLPAMRSFRIAGNNMTGGVDWLTTIDQGVKIVAAGWNDFSGDIPQDGYGWYYDLRLWDLRENNLTGHIPCDLWKMLDKSDNLKWVHMQNNEFGSNATSCMEDVSSPVLQTINVHGNNF